MAEPTIPTRMGDGTVVRLSLSAAPFGLCVGGCSVKAVSTLIPDEAGRTHGSHPQLAVDAAWRRRPLTRVELTPDVRGKIPDCVTLHPPSDAQHAWEVRAIASVHSVLLGQHNDDDQVVDVCPRGPSDNGVLDSHQGLRDIVSDNRFVDVHASFRCSPNSRSVRQGPGEHGGTIRSVSIEGAHCDGISWQEAETCARSKVEGALEDLPRPVTRGEQPLGEAPGGLAVAGDDAVFRLGELVWRASPFDW